MGDNNNNLHNMTYEQLLVLALRERNEFREQRDACSAQKFRAEATIAEQRATIAEQRATIAEQQATITGQLATIALIGREEAEGVAFDELMAEQGAEDATRARALRQAGMHGLPATADEREAARRAGVVVRGLEAVARHRGRCRAAKVKAEALDKHQLKFGRALSELRAAMWDGRFIDGMRHVQPPQ